MLQLDIRDREWFDDNKQMFIVAKGGTLMLEHSLISISKWESKWKKPFLGKEAKTYEETLDYIKCMTLNKSVNPSIYSGITKREIDIVNNYIDDTMTATWFNNEDKNRKTSSQQVTSELIYYWMVAFNIPFECEKWHLNRLFTLIHICEIKNTPSKKMKKKDIYARNRALNASRKRQLGTNG